MAPTLSLCLIVRDEAALLPGCLDSAAPFADEIVVVDTGSTDETVEIARSRGARVIGFAWRDDFAAARNAALAEAGGDFVLFLDADERLEPGSGEALRRLIAAEPPDAPPTVYLPLIVNVDAAGRSLGADHMGRLWRRRPELFYTGRIHEEVGAGVPGLVRRFEDALRIVHLGYDPELAESRGKRTRNRALLDAAIAERPDDPALWFYRAKEDYAAGDDAAALRGFRAVLADPRSGNMGLSACVFAVECQRTLGDPAGALALALEGLAGAPDYGELWFVAGEAALAAGRPIQAEAQFRNALREPTGLAATAFRDPAVRAWRADLGRARALQAQGALAPALDLLRVLPARLPPGPERVRIELELVDALLVAGDQQAAWHLLEPLLDTAPAESTPALLNLIQLYLEVLGAEAAYGFVSDCLTVHPTLLHQLPVVGAAAELAEVLGNDDAQLELLRICVHLQSPYPQHYTALARLLDARGETRAAEVARLAARRRGQV